MVVSVGAIGIHVQPDTSQFNDRLEAALKRANDQNKNKVKIPLDLDAEGIGEKLRVVTTEVQAALDRNSAVLKVPVVGDTSKTMEKLKLSIKRLNEQKGAELKVGLALDENGLREKAKAAANNVGKLKLQAEVDPDTGKIEREMRRLERDSDLTFTPDLTLNPEQVSNLDVKLDADIELRKGTVEEMRARMRELEPLVMSTDAKLNTPTVRKEWDRLIRDLGGHVVDLNVDIKRQAKLPLPVVQAEIEVDDESVSREFSRLKNTSIAVLHPIVEMDRRQLKDLKVDIDADINVRRDRIQKALTDMARLEPWVMSVDPKVNTEGVRLEWERLKQRLSGETIDLKADLDRQNTVKAELAVLTRNRTIDLAVRISKRSLATAEATLQSLTGMNVLRKAGLGVEMFATNLDAMAFSAAKIGTTLASVASSGLALTSSIAGLAGGLAALGGYVLAAPAGIATLVAVFATAKMAFHGFGAALKGTKGALEKLPPQAQAAAKALKNVYASVQVPVQEVFWTKMNGVFESFVNNVVPSVRAGLVGISGGVGNMAAQFIGAFARMGGSGQLDTLFANMAKGVDQAAMGMGPLIEGFMTLALEGTKALPDMGKTFRDMSQDFDHWVQTSVNNGKVTGWIKNAQAAAKDLGRALVGIKNQFSAIVSASNLSGGGNLDTFATKMQQIGTTMQSSAFQNTLATLFAGAHEAIGQVRSALGDLGWALADIAPTLKSVLNISGGTIADVFKALASSITQPAFKDGLVSFFTGIKTGIDGLLTALPQVVTAFGQLGDLFGTVLATALPTVGSLFGQLADIFGTLQPALKELVPLLVSFAGSGLGALLSVLSVLAVPLKLFLEVVTALPAPLQGLMFALLALRKYGSGSGLLGGFSKGSGEAATGIRQVGQSLTPIPAQAEAAKRSLSGKLLGPGFFSSKEAFTPLTTALRGLPGLARGAVAGVSGEFSKIPTQLRSNLVTAGSGASESLRGTFNAIPAGVTEAMNRATSAATGGGGRLSGALKGVATAGMGAMRSLSSFVGGPWGVAMIAGFAVFADAQKQAQILETANKAVTQSYKDIANAAIDAGQGTQGLAAQQAALTKVQDAWGQGLGEHSTGSLGDWIGAAGVDAQSLVNVMTGTGAQETIDKLQSMSDLFAGGDSILPFGLGDNGQMLADKAIIDGMLSTTKEAKIQWDLLWQTEPGRAKAIPAVLEEIKRTSADGKVTAKNINGITTSVQGLKIAADDKPLQYGTAIAQLLGGDPKTMARNALVVNETIRDWQAAGSHSDTFFPSIAKGLLNIGVDGAKIKTVFEGVGNSAEEAGKEVTNAFGVAMTKAGKPLTVLGEQVPKIAELSNGIEEYSKSLGAAAGIDPAVLSRIFSADGLDLGKMARDLPAAGVGLDTIRAALTAAGLTGPQFSSAMAIATEAAGKLTAATGANVGNITDFATAIDAIKNSADGAADKATKLFAALDLLNGGKASTGDLVAGLADQDRELQKWGTTVDGTVDPHIETLKKIFAADPKKIDATVEGYGEVSTALEGVATKGLAVATDAYNREMAASGDSTKARLAAVTSLKGTLTTLDGVQSAAKLTDTQWTALLSTFQLTPDQIEIGVIATTDGALGDLAKVELALQTVKPGAVIPMAISDTAAAELNKLDIHANKMADGTYEISLSADPQTAKDQMAALVKYIETGKPAEMPVTGKFTPSNGAWYTELQAYYNTGHQAAVNLHYGLTWDGKVPKPPATDEKQGLINLHYGLTWDGKVPTPPPKPDPITIPGTIGKLTSPKGLDNNLPPVKLPVTPVLPRGGVTVPPVKLPVTPVLPKSGVKVPAVDLPVKPVAPKGGSHLLLPTTDLPVKPVLPANPTGGFKLGKLPVEVEPHLPRNGMRAISFNPIPVPITPNIDNAGPIISALGNTPITPTVEPKVDGALGAIAGLSLLPILPTVTAQIGGAVTQIFGLSQLPVKPTVSANTGPATGQISALNAVFVQPTVSANTNPAAGQIGALSGIGVTTTVNGDTGPAAGQIGALSGIGVTTSIDGNTSAAQSAINSLNGQTVTVNVTANVGTAVGQIAGIKGGKQADGNFFDPGGLLRRYAGGGYERHNAQIAQTLRLWAEPETGGEAYIPLAYAKRARSLKILSDVATEFGYQLLRIGKGAQGFADGGMVASAGATGRQVVINQYNAVAEKDSTQVLAAGQLISAMGLL